MSKLFTKRMCWTTLETFIRNGEAFHNNSGTFKGVHWDADHASLPGKGKMPKSDWCTLKRIHDQYGIDYVVYSFRTVIAYRDTHGKWYIPEVNYSPTTTAHQNKISVVASKLMERANV